ncbi:hypothetical protein GIB67_024222 [Kingdonia uniflora]|uniref:UDP-N-acetylglucosamine diphosphorylase n=1 Tax=Kingdonia uniflora TaxID=39325 RepID=A0A7J7LZL7_9MAGN|nr:hypothetical protein GIB67_024222 [Kingdonia uniflora]
MEQPPGCVDLEIGVGQILITMYLVVALSILMILIVYSDDIIFPKIVRACIVVFIFSTLDVGLPSGKSLFQLQAERILCLQRLASQSVKEGSVGFVPIHWYIMTSPFTDDATHKFFESHKYFGLEVDQVTFFQQGTIPCISKDGRFIMETPYRVGSS